MTESQIRFPFRDHELENGLRVLLHRDPSTPVVAVHVMYHVGSKDERPGRTGFAHLFEHMLFQGSEHVEKGEHFLHVQNAGGTANGSTSFDRTNYFETLPSNELDLGLWLESDRMGYFASAITPEKLENQRGVVKNERRQVMENRPYGLAGETILHRAFPEGHPYGHHPIGSMEDLDAADVEDVRQFFGTYYRPDNATLVVAGDIEYGDALERVRKWFGEIPGAGSPPRRDIPDVEDRGEVRETLEDRVQVPRVYLVYHAPSFRDPDFEVTDVMSEVLSGGKSSRLHRELVYRRQLAGEVDASAWPLEDTGLLWIEATARPGVEADELESALRDTLEDLCREGAAEGEVEGARNRLKRSELSSLNNVGDRADALAHAAVLRDDPELVNRIFDRYAAVERPDADEMARRVLRPERLTVLHVVPASRADEERAA